MLSIFALIMCQHNYMYKYMTVITENTKGALNQMHTSLLYIKMESQIKKKMKNKKIPHVVPIIQ